jgi:hypothetical protein
MKLRKILLMTVFAFSSLSLLAQSSEWVKLGPDNIGGRVRSVIFDRYNNNVMYAGGVAGGFFISVNNGLNWQEIQLDSGDNASVAVTAICQADDGTIYVGTGESYYNAVSSPGISNDISGMLGNGIYKLDNWSNLNWTASLATDEEKYAYVKANMHFVSLLATRPVKYDVNHEWTYVNDLAFVNGKIFAALAKSFKYSDDGGVTWQNITISGNGITASTQVFVNDIKVNKNGRVAIAYGIASGSVGGESVSDYRVAINSSDNPLIFIDKLNSTEVNSSSPLGRTEMAFGINNPNILYVVCANSTMYQGGAGLSLSILLNVYRTRDLDNVHWTCATASSESFGTSMNTSMSIFVDDRGSFEKIYVGGDKLWYGFDNNSTNGEGLYYWTNETINATDYGGNAASEYPLAYRNSGYFTSKNIHNILIKDNPQSVEDSNMMVIATDGGVYIYHKQITYDPLKPEYVWELSAKGMNNAQLYDVSVATDGSVFGAAKSNSIVYIPKTQDELLINHENGSDVIRWQQINATTIVIDSSRYVTFTSNNYTLIINGDTLTIHYKVNTNGNIIWAPNSDQYRASIYGDWNNVYKNQQYETENGSAVAASMFERTEPSYTKPLILSRQYTHLARTYSKDNSFTTIDKTPWTFGNGNMYLMPGYMNDNYTDNSVGKRYLDPKNTPMVLWESTNAISVDSVDLVIDAYTIINRKHGVASNGEEWKPGARIYVGDTILVKSATYPLNYPFEHVMMQADITKLNGTTSNYVEYACDTCTMKLKVHTPVQSRLFVATNGGVFVCADILDFSRTRKTNWDALTDLVWVKVFSLDNFQTSVITDINVSPDGDVLFVGVGQRNGGDNSVLCRFSGLSTANLRHEMLAQGGSYNTLAALYPSEIPALSTVDTILTSDRPITSMSIDRNNPSTMIVTFGKYKNSASVMLSQNILDPAASVSFINITGIDPESANNIPVKKPVFSSLVESMKADASSHIAYIGAEDGIWKTNDYTENPVNWSKMTDVPNVPVFKLSQQTSRLPYVEYVSFMGGLPVINKYCATEMPGAIYAATYGKGMYAYFGDTISKNNDSVVNVNVVGLDDIIKDNYGVNLNIYPNPAQNEATINYIIASDSKVTFKLYDINGKLVSTIERGSQRAGQHALQMDCRGLMQGVYMVQIITNTSSSTAKLVVQ